MIVPFCVALMPVINMYSVHTVLFKGSGKIYLKPVINVNTMEFMNFYAYVVYIKGHQPDYTWRFFKQITDTDLGTEQFVIETNISKDHFNLG